MPQEKTKSEYARAFDRLNRYLALRDHSRFELRTKLKRWFHEEIVERVITDASKARLIGSEEEIAARAALMYERQNKSRRYIEAKLERRGLPVPPLSAEAEIDKIRALVERRFGLVNELSVDERTRVFRFLSNRGFDQRWIQQVLDEK